MSMSRTRRSAAVVGLGILMASSAAGVGNEWVADPEGIQNVGEITKTSPTGANSTILHYGKTNKPEKTRFHIDTSAATDMDSFVPAGCSDPDPATEEDAGLFEKDTDWIVSPVAGDIDDGDFTTEFTPGNEVKSNITVKCKVFEGHSLSWDDGNHDDHVEKVWDGKLTTFMLRMLVQPGNVVYTEEDPNPVRGLGGFGHAGLHLGKINWTGLAAKPGALPATPLSGAHARGIAWNTRCESDNGIVGGIMGTVSFTPSFVCSGLLKFRATHNGTDLFGSLGTVAAAFAAAYNPYVGASVLFGTWALGSKSHANYGIIGESVIENGAGTTPRINVTGSVQYAPNTFTNLAPLSISVAQTTGVPDFTVKGAYDIKTQLQVHDNSSTSKITALLQMDTSVIGSMQWRTTRPTYTPASP